MTELISSKSKIISLFNFLSQEGKHPALDGYSLEEWQTLLAQAQFQGLAPLLYQRLVKERGKDGLPEEVVVVLRDSYLNCLGKNMVQFNELHKVLFEFQKNGIPTLLLKGSYLAKFIYQNIGLRPMSDLDLMVNRNHLQPALDILKQMGYKGSYLPLSAKELEVYHHAPILEKPGQVILELHWTLVDEGRGLPIDEKDLWQRAKFVQIDNVEALVLAPEDLVIHICVHAAYSHCFFNQARSVVDLAEILKAEILKNESGCFNWQAVIDIANQWQAERGVFLMLYLAQHYMHAPVPADVLIALQPSDFNQFIIDDIFCLFDRKEPNISPLVSQLVNNTLRGKVNALFLAAFPGRVELGRMYQIEARSWKALLYYPRLWRDKLIRQWRPAINLLTGRNKTGRNLKAIYKIQTWLQIPVFKVRK